MERICELCQHWDWPDDYSRWGTCRLTRVVNGTPDHPASTARPMMIPGDAATYVILATRDDFGCVQYTPGGPRYQDARRKERRTTGEGQGDV